MNSEPIKVDRITIEVPAPTDGAHRTNTFRYLLDNLVKPRSNTMVDLGAGHCLFSKIARDRGYKVTAVDGRTVRLPSEKDLGSIKFVQSDIRGFDPRGFGLVICFGLFYHLTIEDQEELLRRCRDGGDVIVETEVHHPDMVTSKSPEPWQTDIIKIKDYEGIMFTEGDNPMASIGNKQSFWHTESSMVKIFEKCGYKSVTIIDPRFQSKYGARQFFWLKC